ncbi:MAG: pilus assembly protein TadG-related protein [Planctomycetota bacterium]
MVFGAISLFILVSFTAMVFNVGQVVSHRVEVQNAADAAARSGALAEANMVSTVAFLNDGMAYIYYNMIRYATNVTVFGVLAELKETGPPFPSDQLVGVDDPVGRYNQAYQEADTWVPRCHTWLGVIDRMSRAIALSGDKLVKREMRRTAVANVLHDVDGARKGVEAMALFPDFSMLPHLGGYLRLDIDQIDPNNGWHITSSTGYMIEIRRVGDHEWLITSSDGGQIQVERVGVNHYILTSGNHALEIERPSDTHVIVHVTGKDEVHIDCSYLQGIGWAVHAVSDDVQVQYEPFRDGGFMVTVIPGGSVGVRRGADGFLEMWNGLEWVPVPGHQEEITVGGVTIPVQQSSTIALPGNASLDLPNTIHVGPITYHIPDCVQIGNTSIQLRRDSVRITARIGPATFVIDDMGAQPYLEVNGLTTADADGTWRVLSERGTRHRLQWPYRDDNFWIYEYVSNASYLFPDNIQRLAHHAIHDNDPFMQANGAAQPAWMEWFNPVTGNLISKDAYHQTRESWDPALTNYTDEDDNEFVRKYASDMFDRNNKKYVTIDLNAMPRPMRLTNDFLRFGINVAVWRDKDAAMLEGGEKGVLRFNVFENPSWGYFAIASARCAFLDRSGGAYEWRTTFDTNSEITAWIERSYQNLYEPVWTAMLVSTREAIKSEHIDAIPPDTGTNFMWRGLAGGQYTWLGHTRGGATWHDPDPPGGIHEVRKVRDDVAGKFRDMRNRQGTAFDHTSPDLPDAIDH